MRRPPARLGLPVGDAVADDVRQMLVKGAAPGHVENLETAADGEHGHPRASAARASASSKRSRSSSSARRARGARRRRRPRGGPGPRRGRRRRRCRAASSIASPARGGATTGMPPACSTARRYLRPRAISSCGGSPCGVGRTDRCSRISDVVTTTRGRTPSRIPRSSPPGAPRPASSSSPTTSVKFVGEAAVACHWPHGQDLYPGGSLSAPPASCTSPFADPRGRRASSRSVQTPLGAMTTST